MSRSCSAFVSNFSYSTPPAACRLENSCLACSETRLLFPTTPFWTNSSSTISLSMCSKNSICSRINFFTPRVSKARRARFWSRMSRLMSRQRSWSMSKRYSVNWWYNSPRFEVGRTVKRTVSSLVAEERGRNEVTILILSVVPSARRAWCSMYRPWRMTADP